MAGGDAGVRLLDTQPAHVDFAKRFRSPRRSADQASDGRFQLVPTHCIFGSEELSGRSGPIVERGPAAYVVLSPDDAQRLGVTEAMGVRCANLGASMGVRIDAALAPGVAALCVGLGGLGNEVPGQRVELTADADYVAPPTDPRDSAQVIARG